LKRREDPTLADARRDVELKALVYDGVGMWPNSLIGCCTLDRQPRVVDVSTD
jgi:hypothetical protein